MRPSSAGSSRGNRARMTPQRPASAVPINGSRRSWRAVRSSSRVARMYNLQKAIERIQDRHDERVKSARFFGDSASARWKALRPSFQERRAIHRKLRQGTLEVKLCAARNLTADSNDHGLLADPIACITLLNADSRIANKNTKDSPSKSCEQRSECRYKTRSPQWHQDFVWRAYGFSERTKLQFSVYDCDIGDSNFKLTEHMGSCTLEVGQHVFAAMSAGSGLEETEKDYVSENLPLFLTRDLENTQGIGGNKTGMLELKWRFLPDGSPIAALGTEMIDEGIARGLKLRMFKRKLGTSARKAVGQFADKPCLDSPEQVVPFLKAIFEDIRTKESHPSESSNDLEPQIPGDVFQDLLALVMHKNNEDIANLVRGMDVDASGFVGESEASTFFLQRSEAASQRGKDIGAWCLKAGIATRISSPFGAGGVSCLHSFATNSEDSWSGAVVVGMANVGGAKLFTNDFQHAVDLNFSAKQGPKLGEDFNSTLTNKLRHVDPLVTSCSSMSPFTTHLQEHHHRRIFVACSDRKVRAFDVPKRGDSLWAGRSTRRLKCQHSCLQSAVPHALEVLNHDVTQSSDPLLFIGCSDGCVSIRDCLDMTNIVATYPNAHAGSVSCIQHIRGSNLDSVLTAGLDGTILTVDYRRGRKPKLLFSQKNGVIAMDFSRRHHTLYTGDFSQKVRLWDPFVQRSTGMLGSNGVTGHRADLVGLVAVDKKNQIITIDRESVIKVWDIRTLRTLQTIKDPEQQSPMVALARDNTDSLLTGGSSLHRWNTLSAQEERENRALGIGRAQKIISNRKSHGYHKRKVRETAGASSVTEMTVNPQPNDRKLFCLGQNDTVVVVTADGDVTLCKSTSNKPLHHFKFELRHGHIVTSATVDKMMQSIFVGCSDGSVRQFHLETSWHIQTFDPRPKEVGSLCFLNLRRDWELVGGGWDKKLCGWNVDGKKRIVHRDGHQGDISVVIQVEEGMLVSGDSAGKISLWSAISSKPLKSFQLIPLEHSSGAGRHVKRAQFEPAIEDMLYLKPHRLLLVGSADGRVIALSATTLASNGYASTIKTFDHAGVEALCLDDSGGYLMVQDAGHRLRLWKLGKDKSQHRLMRCWQPLYGHDLNSTVCDEIGARKRSNTDPRMSYNEDRGSICYLSSLKAFVTAQVIDRKIGIDLWSSESGERLHSMYWAHHPSKQPTSAEKPRDRCEDAVTKGPERVQQKITESRSSCKKSEHHMIKPPVLGSLGEYALELDRMKLLENKDPTVSSIFGKNIVEPKEIHVHKRNSGIGESGARARLERQLQRLHMKGVICNGTKSGDRKLKLMKRKLRGEMWAAQSIR